MKKISLSLLLLLAACQTGNVVTHPNSEDNEADISVSNSVYIPIKIVNNDENVKFKEGDNSLNNLLDNANQVSGVSRKRNGYFSNVPKFDMSEFSSLNEKNNSGTVKTITVKKDIKQTVDSKKEVVDIKSNEKLDIKTAPQLPVVVEKLDKPQKTDKNIKVVSSIDKASNKDAAPLNKKENKIDKKVEKEKINNKKIVKKYNGVDIPDGIELIH